MRLQMFPQNSVISAIKRASFPNSTQGVLKHDMVDNEFISRLLDRRWALSSPDAKVNQIMILNGAEGRLKGDISFRNITQPFLEDVVKKNHSFPSFYVVRDDLLHPLINGNKGRKLDALLPLLEDNAVTDVVTCGGCQSAHTAAVAVSCAERGLKSHLLLRGEEPQTLTGYNLVSRLYGNVVYVPRSIYSNREEMLARYAKSVVGHNGTVIRLADIMEASYRNHAARQQNILQADPVTCLEKSRKIAIINEGAGDVAALLGVIRLIQYLSQNDLFGKNQALKIIVDAGTGTTAVGLGLGVLCLGYTVAKISALSFSLPFENIRLPWEVTAVMLADKIDGYKEKEQILISGFLRSLPSSTIDIVPNAGNVGIVQWVERSLPRKFGNILKGEVQECQKVAKETGILLDPIYTLAAWDLATQLSQNGEKDTKVVMIHTGGTLGMFGLAQRYRSHFQMPEESGKR